MDGGRALLRFSIVDSAWRQHRITPLIPDHGHLVHLFLVRDGLDAFAHLHPVFVDSSDFDATLPPLPAGRYRVYADVTRESGFAETLTDTIMLTQTTGPWRPSDSDDAWWTGEGGVGRGTTVTFADGSRMVWNRGGAPLVAGQDTRCSPGTTGRCSYTCTRSGRSRGPRSRRSCSAVRPTPCSARWDGA
jgi:hypothetical protein